MVDAIRPISAVAPVRPVAQGHDEVGHFCTNDHYTMRPFTQAEDLDLLRAVQDGVTVAEIALDLGRRQSDIIQRLRRLVRHERLRSVLPGRFSQAQRSERPPGVSTPDAGGEG